MPIYNFVCEKCEHEFNIVCKIADRKNIPCQVCGGTTWQKLTAYTPISFKSGYYEHIGPKPIRIGNKQQLRDACNEHGVSSVYLDDC